MLRQAEGSREFIVVHAEVTAVHETSRHKFPINDSKLVGGTCNYVTNSWYGGNDRRGFVFFVQVKQGRGGRRRQLLFPDCDPQEVILGLGWAPALYVCNGGWGNCTFFLRWLCEEVRGRWQKLTDKERKKEWKSKERKKEKSYELATEKAEVDVARTKRGYYRSFSQ